MNQKELNLCAEKYLEDYKCYMSKSHSYEIKGIYHSELLMMITIANELNIERIIESGRARGQSTELIGRFCKDKGIEFHSIESNSSTIDVDIAEERTKDIPVHLHFGDSFVKIPEILNNSIPKRTLILIDGPKGTNMWKLFENVMIFPFVLGCFMHDSYEGSSIRNNLNKEYKDKYLISDDPGFVENYKFLDDECWKVNPWGPYEMGSYIQGKLSNLHKCKSYAGTLSFVGNK